MSFPRYERYKDCGVEWLGELPEHWEVRRLKHDVRLLTREVIQPREPCRSGITSKAGLDN